MISVVVNELDVMGGTHKQVLRFSEFLKNKNETFEIITKYYSGDKSYPGFSALPVRSLPKSMYNGNKLFELFFSLLHQFNLFFLMNRETKKVNVHDNGLVLFIFLCLFSGRDVYWQINDLPGPFRLGNSKGRNQRFLSKIYAFFYKKIYRTAARLVKEVTVNVTKNQERIFENLGVTAKVFYCGVDPWGGSFVKHKESGFRLLSSGVFFPYRNYEAQIETVKLLKEKGCSITLDIIGETRFDKLYFEKINKLIDNYSLSDVVTIHGQVDHEKYVFLHENSDIFLFLNIDQSWGLAVFEAMSAGLPVLVSESVGATEILNDGVDAIIVPPSDIEYIASKIISLADEGEYSSFSRKALESVKNYTWDEMYSKKLYCLMKGSLV